MQTNNNKYAVVGIAVERNNLVSTVELFLLNHVGTMTNDKYSCSWHKLVKHVVKSNVTKHLYGQPIEWIIFNI